MANDLKLVFIDYAKKLQEYLDQLAPNVFIVSSGKNLNVKVQDKVQVLVSYLQGGAQNEDSVSIPVMLKIYSCAELQQKVIGTFIALSKMKAQSFYTEMVEVKPNEVEEAHIFEKITTPAVMQEDVQFGNNNHWTEYIAFCDIVALFGVGNLKSITIDGETISFLNGSLAFATQQFSNRDSGGPLNKQKNRTATTNLQFQLVFKTGVFSKKIWDLYWGDVDKNTIFMVDVELTNGYKKQNVAMCVNSDNLAVNKQIPSLPSLNVVLTLAETRTM